MRKRSLLLLVLAVLLAITACAPDMHAAGEIPPEQTPPTEPVVHTHSYAEKTVAPTCTQRGYTRYTCSCGDSYTVYTEAAGHQWDAGILLEEASENHYERRSYTCQVCHEQQENFVVNGQPYAPRPGNSDYGFRYLGTQENGLEKQNMYLRIYEACEAFMHSGQDVTEETKYQLLIAANDLSYEEFWDIFGPAYEIFLFDNTWYYWLAQGYTEPAAGLGGYPLDIGEEYYLASTRREYEAAIEEMAQECAAMLTNRMTQAEKAQVIYDYIRWHMDYAYDANREPLATFGTNNIASCALNRLDVCEAYAKVFRYLCLLNDVPCLYVYGPCGDELHAWNYFQAEGVWYATDICWGDGSAAAYDYFGCAEAFINRSRRPNEADGAWYILPEPSSERLKLQTLHILPFFTEIPESYFLAADTIARVDIPDTVTCINRFAFSGCTRLKCVTIPVTVTEIGWLAFSHNEAMTDICYGGTKERWAAINFGKDWDFETGEYTVHCTDGDIPKAH